MTTALMKLQNSIMQSKQQTSLMNRVKAHQDLVRYPAVLLLDVSGSMSEHCEPGKRKIDALREIVNSLRGKGVPFRQVVFNSDTQITDAIPNPSGGTALDRGLDAARTLSARKVIVVTDGEPDCEQSAMEAANRLKFETKTQIDVFYVGPGNQRAEEFLKKLAAVGQGQYQQTDLAQAPQIAHKVVGLLSS